MTIFKQVEDIYRFPKQAGVYKITNLSNGKAYIGESKDMRARMVHHRTSTSKSKKHCFYFARALKKYGFFNFKCEILETFPSGVSKNTLIKREKFWITLFDTLNQRKGYNLILRNSSKEPDYKALLRKTAKKRPHLSKGKKRDKKQYESWLYAMKDYVPSAETREKHRKRMIGNSFSKGIKHTEETKKKVRERMKEGNEKKRCRHVLQIDIKSNEVIKEWISCAHAARELIGNPNAHTFIAKVARNEKGRKNAYGFAWKFKDGIGTGLTKHKKNHPIHQINMFTDEIICSWWSPTDAAKYLNSIGILAHIGQISTATKDFSKSSAGFKWKYISDDDADKFLLKRFDS